jgi:hypothetical protein
MGGVSSGPLDKGSGMQFHFVQNYRLVGAGQVGSLFDLAPVDVGWVVEIEEYAFEHVIGHALLGGGLVAEP